MYTHPPGFPPKVRLLASLCSRKRSISPENTTEELMIQITLWVLCRGDNMELLRILGEGVDLYRALQNHHYSTERETKKQQQ